MRVRAQISKVFHLDKCIGCHTCSIACKNLWTDRPGTEYMWWNNVETKPGTGYPTLYEDQGRYRGGWELVGGKRGGGHNSLTRMRLKPVLMVGGYAQHCYRFNDYGPAAPDRDTYVVVRRLEGEPRFD